MPNLKTNYGGISSDRYFSSGKQYQMGTNIETRRNPRYVELSRKNEVNYGTGDYLQYCFLGYNIIGDSLISSGQDGWIYIDGVSRGQLGQVAGEIGDTIDINILNNNFYFFRNDRIYYDSISNIESGNAGFEPPAGPNIITTKVEQSSARFSFNKDDTRLFFVNRYKLAFIDKDKPGTVINLDSTNQGEFIVGFTFHADNIWIYTESGKFAIYSLSKDEIISVKYYDEKIYTIYGDKNYDYVWTGDELFNNGDLTMFINSGTGPNSSSEIVTSQNDPIGILGGSIDKYNMLIKTGIGGRSNINKYKNIIYYPSGDILSSYGKQNNNYPNSFQYDVLEDTFTSIGAVYVWNSILYYSIIDGDDNTYVKTIDLKNFYVGGYTEEGKLLYNCDDGGDWSIEKELNGPVKIGCHLPENTSITLSYLLDGTRIGEPGIGTEVYGTYTSDDLVRGGIEDVKHIGTFREIDWLITLNSSDGVNTPKVYNLVYNLKPING